MLNKKSNIISAKLHLYTYKWGPSQNSDQPSHLTLSEKGFLEVSLTKNEFISKYTNQ